MIFALAAASPAHAAGECTPLKNFQTLVTINLTVGDPYYDMSMDWPTLARKRQSSVTDWLARNHMQGVWNANEMRVAGDASGGYGMETHMRFIAKPFEPTYGVHYCPFFQSLTIDLFYRTLIEIPKEFQQHPCVFQTVNDHELKHNAVNTAEMREFTERLRTDIQAMVGDMEQHYVLRTRIDQRENDMEHGIEDALHVYFGEAMGQKMTELNGLVDSPQEYATRSAMMDACNMTEKQ